jgi:hypothetical protein
MKITWFFYLYIDAAGEIEMILERVNILYVTKLVELLLSLPIKLIGLVHHKHQE